MIKVDDKIKEHLIDLNPGEENISLTILELLEHEYRRRLTHYENINETFKKKYNMTFDEFEERNIVREKMFSWDVESDAMDWEQAIDGIKTMKKKLGDVSVIRTH